MRRMMSVDIKTLYEMSEDQIWSEVFRGALAGEYRSLQDAFGVDGVYALIGHPEYEAFTRHLQDFIWMSVQALDLGDNLPKKGDV